MTNKKPNFIIEFDDSNPTKEEQEKAFYDLFNLLLKMEMKQRLLKIKNVKERHKTEKDLTKFSLKVLSDVQKQLKDK